DYDVHRLATALIHRSERQKSRENRLAEVGDDDQLIAGEHLKLYRRCLFLRQYGSVSVPDHSDGECLRLHTRHLKGRALRVIAEDYLRTEPRRVVGQRHTLWQMALENK